MMAIQASGSLKPVALAISIAKPNANYNAQPRSDRPALSRPVDVFTSSARP